MSRRGKFLFFTLVTLVLLTQIVILRWGPEAVFFVTWLFLALAVQHDSRISAAVGLAFLATCPFLLIAEKEAVAEQAANYAYFFLAIGVLVQLEDLLLERYGWLERKLDLSFVWQPVDRALRRLWRVALATLRRVGAVADRDELARMLQILGSGGLAAVFLWTAYSRAPIRIVLPLLGGALLFPFVVWSLRSALRALGSFWLLRGVFSLAVLTLAAAMMVWLHGLLTADRLASMQTVYDFVEYRRWAQRTSALPDGETVEAKVWTINNEAKWVLYQHPPYAGASRLAYTVWMNQGYVLVVDLSTAPESWNQPGDGVTFAVYVESEKGTEQLLCTYIDPKRFEADRRWHSYTFDMSSYAGQTVTIIFETGTGPNGDYRYDWAGWGAPRLLAP